MHLLIAFLLLVAVFCLQSLQVLLALLMQLLLQQSIFIGYLRLQQNSWHQLLFCDWFVQLCFSPNINVNAAVVCKAEKAVPACLTGLLQYYAAETALCIVSAVLVREVSQSYAEFPPAQNYFSWNKLRLAF